MGLVERHPDGSRVKTTVVGNRRKHELEQTIGADIEAGSTITPMRCAPPTVCGRARFFAASSLYAASRVEFRPSHSQQLIYERGKCVKLLGLAWHVASIAMFLASCALAQESQTPQTPPVGRDSSSSQTVTQQPIQISVTNPPPSTEEREREARNTERELAIQESVATYNERLVWVGIAQVAASLFALFAAWRASAAAEKSAVAADASARIALAQKRIGDRQLETSKAIERAYLNANHVISFKGFATGSVPEVLIEIRNSGHTPGWILRTGVATIDVEDVAKHLPRPFPVGEIGMRPNSQVVFSGQRTTFGNLFNPVTAAVESAIMNGSKLVIFGRVEYRDTFNDTHYTDFSFVWDAFKPGVSGQEDFHIHPDGYVDAT